MVKKMATLQKKQWSSNYPHWGNQAIQMYDIFVWFAYSNALFALVKGWHILGASLKKYGSNWGGGRAKKVITEGGAWVQKAVDTWFHVVPHKMFSVNVVFFCFTKWVFLWCKKTSHVRMFWVSTRYLLPLHAGLFGKEPLSLPPSGWNIVGRWMTSAVVWY